MILNQQKLPQQSRKLVCPPRGARHSLTTPPGSRSNPAAQEQFRSASSAEQEVTPVRLIHLNERPSAITAACAHVHAQRVGRVAVLGVPGYRWRLTAQPVA